MECTAEKKGDALVLSITGRLDANTSPDFERECSKWIEQGETWLVLELSGLDYISSAGLRTILATGKKLRSRKGQLMLCQLQKMVEEVFTISGFTAYLPIKATLDEALAEA